MNSNRLLLLRWTCRKMCRRLSPANSANKSRWPACLSRRSKHTYFSAPKTLCAFRIMPRSIFRLFCLTVVWACLFGASVLFAADYQWSVSVEGTSLTGLDPGYPRAFLWIPPTCKQVRAIVLSENNMEEESILEDVNFRKTLSDLGFAEIWITPSSE